MIDLSDITALIDEPKSARMAQRTKPHVKAQIQLAAALLGVDETTFVTASAYEHARVAIADHQRTVLYERDHNALLAALDTPPEPTHALRNVMALRPRMAGDRVGRSSRPFPASR